MICIHEFEFYPEEDMVLAVPFDLLGGTEGYDFDDAVSMAAEWLRIHAEHALMQGDVLPNGTLGHSPVHGGTVIAIAVDADLSRIAAVTASEAARALGVTPARVCQLCKAGLLESWKTGGTRMVSVDSVVARLEERGAAAARPAIDGVTVTCEQPVE